MKKSRKIINKKYLPAEIEPKWQAKWEKEGVYQPDLENAKRPFYNLMMFPYPSAEGLHVGSVYTFTGVDAYGRFKRMQGYDVFEPIGLDGFGIHSENHAIKTHSHPIEHAKRTEENFYRQLHEIGNSYDWRHKVETYNPGYYKWTQWLFTELFKAGLAYRKKSPVNFCPSCKTVLADEQVIDGTCERCGSLVEKRNLEQWFFRTTNYAEKLLGNIANLNWTEKVKIAQTEWIGKKVGINITYKVENTQEKITVFTTRPDTNFGATFIALAPDSEITNKILSQIQDKKIKKEIQNYIEKTKSKSEIDRQTEGREKTGVFTGLYAINELTGYKMPVWVSDFVLGGFGTGALVGVPGHDKRDFEFAHKFGLEIIRVVVGKDGDKSTIKKIEQVQEEEGTMINSDFLIGLDIHEATNKIMDYMEEKGYGLREVNYHLRDWLISRQRYWGPPIPMIFCESCAKRGASWFTSREGSKNQEVRIKKPPKGTSFKEAAQESGKERIGNLSEAMPGWYPVPEDQLPVELPFVEDYKPLGTGKAPLANYPEFYETTCPQCGGKAQRETDVSDTFLDSSWYFLRYLATDWDDLPFPSVSLVKAKKESVTNKKEMENGKWKMVNASRREAWLPVTMYIGGAEHAVLHLLYARFITMVLHDLGYIDFEEPFLRFYAHGLIIKDGAKMSKSKGNVVNPDVYIRKFGADTLRTYLRFLGPFDQTGDFRDTGIEGMYRFLKRVWNLLSKIQALPAGRQDSFLGLNKEALNILHTTIRGVTEDMEALHYNTAIAKLMTWYNFLSKQAAVSHEEASVFLQLLAPFAPHMTEELWEQMGNDFSIHTSKWPVFDMSAVQVDTVKIPVQVNGKLRGMLEVNIDKIGDAALIEEMAKQDKTVGKFIEGTIRKVIYVPGKILNFVIV